MKQMSVHFRRLVIPLPITLLLILGFLLMLNGQPENIVKAQVITLPAEINKSFSPIAIIPGTISRLSVSIYNPNSFPLADAGWLDNLDGVQPGISIANPANVSSNCGGSVTADPGTTTLSLSEGDIPAQVGINPGSCTLSVDVTSVTQGNLVNTIPAGGLTASGGGATITNTTPASATLRVDTVLSPSVTKAFNPTTVWAGQSSQLTIVIRNNDLSTTLTETSLTDFLPTNVVLANPVSPSLSGCGGSATLTAVSGTGSAALNNGQISPNSTCTIRVNVVSTTQGVYPNIIPAGPTGVGSIRTHQGVTNTALATDTLYVQALNLTKAFSPSSIPAGGTSTVTLTLQNPTNIAYTGVNLTDSLPAGLTVSGVPASPQCGGVITSTANSVTLTGGTIPASTTPPTLSTCTITFLVATSPTASTSTITNYVEIGDLRTDQGISNPARVSANLSVQAGLTVLKAYSPTTISAGGTSTVTITLRNHTAAPFNIISLTDALPAGLTVLATPAPATTCVGGSVTYSNSPSPSSVTLTGGAIPAAPTPPATPGTCTITFPVTASTADTYSNTIPASSVTTTQGVTNLTAATTSPVLTVTAGAIPPTAAKSFSPTTIMAGANSRLRINITAPIDTSLTNVSITDIFPAGITVSNSTAPTAPGCGTFTSGWPPAIGATSLSVSGGTIAAGATCQINVYVTSSAPGVFTNTITPAQFTNTEGRTLTRDRTAGLTVTSLTAAKSFIPPTVNANGLSTLTITLTNNITSPLNIVTLTDILPGSTTNGVVVAPIPNAITTCTGGAITAAPGTQSITLSGGVIPARVGAVPGACTIQVNVQGRGSTATYTNTLFTTNVSATVQGTGTLIRPAANATANLSISPLSIGIVKGFNPLTVFGGSASTMSIQLVNPSTALLTGIGFTDTMPAGMIIANPASFNIGTCGGALAGSPGDGSFTFSGGSLPAGGTCTMTLSATMTVNGNLTNVIPAGSVSTFNGATNPDPAQATLTNLPGASVSKYFSPSTIVAGGANYSLLTISIQNTGNVPLVNLGLADNLPGVLPAGLEIAGSPAPVNNCGGTLTAAAGTQLIQLSGGSLAGASTCTLVVPVTSTIPGTYINTIPANSLTNTGGVTNNLPATDTLITTGTPALAVTKSATSTGPYNLNDTITYSIVAENTGNTTLTGVTITDPGVGAVLGTCTPTQPATLAPNATLTCAATHVVTQADIDAGSYANTAFADSSETDPVSEGETVTIAQNPALAVTKTATSTGPYDLNDTITYSIVAENTGNTTLTGVTITDPGVGAVLGTCTPTQPATLAPNATLTCAATHVVTQADIDAGSYANTAFADSSETAPVSEGETVTIAQNPALAVTKSQSSAGPYALNDTITYSIVAENTGNMTLTGVTITDPGVGAVLGTCTPAQPATLAPNATLTCAATHVVTLADIDAGSYANTAFADSSETAPVSEGETVTIAQNPALAVTKTATSTGPYDLNDTITYSIVAENTGNIDPHRRDHHRSRRWRSAGNLHAYPTSYPGAQRDPHLRRHPCGDPGRHRRGQLRQHRLRRQQRD